ncbi:MAG: hypothetical protein EBS23_03615 [Betaproteobacteria bacterium]|nr:hypothetical protein [Betaproteobacteria bacterium]
MAARRCPRRRPPRRRVRRRWPRPARHWWRHPRQSRRWSCPARHRPRTWSRHRPGQRHPAPHCRRSPAAPPRPR